MISDSSVQPHLHHLDRAPEKELWGTSSPFIPAQGCSGSGLLSVQGCWAHSLQPWVFVCPPALEGTDAGKGAVLGDLVEVPSVPLITGKLLSISML